MPVNTTTNINQEPPSKKLWQGLVDEDLYSGSYDDFTKKYSTKEELDKLHTGLIEENLYSKGRDEFETQYFPELKKKETGGGTYSTLQVGGYELPTYIPAGTPKQTQEGEVIPTDELTQNIEAAPEEIDPIALAIQAKKLRGNRNAYSYKSNLYGGNGIEMETGAQFQLTDINDKLKQGGYNLGELTRKYGDLPEQFLTPERKKYYLQLEKDNPEYLERLLAADKWHTIFNQEIQKGVESGDISSSDANYINDVIKQGSGASTHNYAQRREDTKEILGFIDKYIKDDDTKEKLRNYYNTDRSYSYGSFGDMPGKEEALASDPNAKYLNENELIGLHYLEDTNPDAASSYSQIMVNAPANDEDNWKARLGWEDKSKTLEQFGIGLQMTTIREKLNSLITKQQAGTLTEADNELAQKLLLKSEKLSSDLSNLNRKYPKATFYDTDNIAKEITGYQDVAGVNYFSDKVLSGLASPLEGLYNSVQALSNSLPQMNNMTDITRIFEGKPNWVSDEKKNNDLLAIAGGNIAKENRQYRPQEFQMLKNFEIRVSDNLNNKIDEVLNDNNLSLKDKNDKVAILLRSYPNEYSKVPIKNGRVNVNPVSLFYGVTDLVAGLVPFIAAEYGAAPLMGTSAYGKFASAFSAALGTSLNDNYEIAVRQGVTNPYEYALKNSAIDAYFLAGAGTPDLIKKVAGGKSVVGKLINSMDDKAIQDIINKSSKSSAVKNFFKNTGAHIKESLIEGGKFEAITGTGRIAKNMSEGKEINLGESATEAAVGMLNFGTLGAISATSRGAVDLVNQKIDVKKSELKNGALLQASQNPDTWIASAKSQLDKGIISPSDFSQIKKNIELASEINKNINYIDDNGNELSVKNKANLLSLKVEEAKLNEQKNSGVSNKLIEKIDGKLDEVSKEIENQTVPEKEEKVPTTEKVPVYKINGKEVTKQELIDFVDKVKKGEITEQYELGATYDNEMQDLIETIPGMSSYEYEKGGQKVVEAPTVTPIENPSVVITGTRKGFETISSVNHDEKKGDKYIYDARGKEFDENNTRVDTDNEGNKIVHFKADAVDDFSRDGNLQISIPLPKGTDINIEAVKKVFDEKVNELKKTNPYLELNKVSEFDFKDLQDRIVNELKNPTNEPIPSTGEKISGTVRPNEEVPEEQKTEAGLPTGAGAISTGRTEATATVLEPKDGDMVTLPPQIKGGMERKIIFKDGEWKQQVGGQLTGISQQVKDLAQAEFNKTQAPVKMGELPKTKADVVASELLSHLGIAPTEVKTTEITPTKSEVKFSKTTEEQKIEGKLDGKPATFVKTPENLEVVNGFYSPIEKRLLETKADKLSANKWKEIVGKGDEAKFTGVLDYLESLPPTQQVSKSEIQKWMKENRIEISEVVKEEPTEEDINLFLNDEAGEGYTREEAIDYLKDVQGDATKYSGYQLPGEKTNYKEVLITLPKKGENAIKEYNSIRDDYDAFLKEAGNRSVTDAERAKNEEFKSKLSELKEKIGDYGYIGNRGFAYPKEGEGARFKSSHYDEPNILAHIRMNTRVDAEGNKVLHIEEFQSDWGQKGRKEGFGKKMDISIKESPNNRILTKDGKVLLNTFSDKEIKDWQIERAAKESGIDINELITDKSKSYYSEVDGRKTAGNFLTKEEATANANDEASRVGKSDTPEAPFVTKTADWTKLAWKVALKEAVKEGADKITWTTGEQQNDRYDLSKTVDGISYAKNADGTYYVSGQKDGKSIFHKDNLNEKELEANIGKEVAQKIINGEGEKDTNKPGRKLLQGDDLKVGGSGMKGFYGSPSEGKLGVVGEVAKSLFKQEPKTTELKTSEFSAGYRKIKDTEGIKESSKQGLRFVYEDKNISKQKAYEIIEGGGEVKAFLPDITSSQHSIDITPEMRAQVEAGLPRFSKKQYISEPTEMITDEMNSLGGVNIEINPGDIVSNKGTLDVNTFKGRDGIVKQPKVVSISDFKGKPIMVTISDELTSGNVTNPITGEVIDNLNGGVGFNYTEGNTEYAWAYTNEKVASDVLKVAKEMYKAHPELYPDGIIPVAVVKMGKSAMVSNEAVIREVIQNLKDPRIPEKNKQRALKALVVDVKNQIKTVDARIKKAKGNETPSDAAASKGYKDILNLLNNVKTFDELLSKVNTLNIGTKPLLIERFTSGNPDIIPAENRMTVDKPAARILMNGLPKSEYKRINLGHLVNNLTDPSLKNVPDKHIISFVGIDAKADAPVKNETHPNYPFALKGKGLGVLDNTVHLANAMPSAYGNVLSKLISSEESNKPVTNEQALSAGLPAALNNKIFRNKTLSERKLDYNKLVGWLQLAFPNTHFFTDSKTWDNIVDSPDVKKYLKNGDIVYGMTKDGHIYLNPKYDSLNTPIHEVGHLHIDLLENTNPDLFNKGISLVDGTKEHQDAIKELGDNVNARKEALATLIGNKGETIVNAALKAKFKEWLISVYKYIQSKFPSLKSLTPEQIADLTLDKFINGSLRDILSGKELLGKKGKVEVPAFSKENKTQKIQEFIDTKRKEGVSDKDIQEGLNKVKDQIGLTEADINTLMKGTPEVKVEPVKVEPVKEEPKVEPTLEPKKVGLSKAEIAKQVEEFSMLPPSRRAKITDVELNEMADDAIAGGYDAEKLVKDLRSDDRRAPNDLEVTILNKYAAALNAEQSKNPSKETLKKYTEAMDAARKAFSLAGATLRQAQNTQLAEDNLSNFLVDKQTSQGAPLSETQIKQETAKFQELKKAKDELEAQLKIQREQYEKLIAEVGLNKAKAITKKSAKKTSEQYKADRASAIESAREALKKVRSGEAGLNSSVPYVNELIAITPHVKKYMTSLIAEGVDKLDNIITDIHAEFKDLVDGLTKKDVRDIIAGKYDEIKSTKNEIAAKKRMLQREAKLLNELDAARKGEQTAKTEKERVAKSRRIQELEEQIKAVREINKEIDVEPIDETDKDGKRLKARQTQILNKIKKLEEDLKTGNIADEKQAPPPLILDQKTKSMMNKVAELEDKIRAERAKDEYEKKPKWIKGYDKVMEVLGLRRLIGASLDWSIPFRQGAPLFSPRHIATWSKSFKSMALSTAKTENFNRLMYEIRHSEDYHDMVKDGIVFNDLKNVNQDQRNEEFQNSFIYRIPVIGDAVAKSNMAADAFLNTSRYELYMKFKRNLERQGITRQSDPKAYKEAAHWAMAMTGRGKLLEALEGGNAQKLLGNTFFGARLMASRFNLLNAPRYLFPAVGLGKRNKQVARESLKDMTAWVGTIMTVGAALAASGGQISLNPDDPDFLQARFGSKVYDISGGMAAYVRTFLRLTGAVTDRLSSKKKVADKKTESAFESTTRFFRNKLAPNTGYAADFYFGEKTTGEPFDPTDIVKLYPMYTDDVIKAYQEDGVLSLATVFLPNVLGVGYGDYKRKPSLSNLYPDSPGTQFFKANGIEMPNLPKVDKIEVNKDAKHPEGLLSPEEQNEFTEIWKKELISNLNDVADYCIKKNIKPTEEQMKEIKTKAVSAAGIQTHEKMQRARKYRRDRLKTREEERFSDQIIRIISKRTPNVPLENQPTENE